MLEGVLLGQSFFEISKLLPRLPEITKVKPTGFESKCSDSDEFRMFTFKIKRCSKTRSHDWTECPYAHRGEKAQRRDPLKFNYYGITCQEFRRGGCPRGDACEFAHGVFEFWLHPARYRTRACASGQCCRRKVCFFAHTPEQLRVNSKCTPEDFPSRRNCIIDNGRDVGERITSRASPEKQFSFLGDWDFLMGMRKLKMDDGDHVVDQTCLGGRILDDAPDIDWISELVSFE